MNLNYLFHVEYYSEFEYEHFEKCNKRLIEQRFKCSESEKIPFTEDSFVLKTLYPGLLFGIGNIHESGNELVDGTPKKGGEIKLGFTLDYSTGLPIIPGSTVKGVLRSAFRNYPEYIAEKLGIPEDDMKNIENYIFGKNDMGVCIFHDAIPIRANKNNRILGLENITPHKELFKNPKPLNLLKVIPEVEFIFRFNFDDYNEGAIPAERLKNTFKNIFIEIGLGAKTNVGFGVMEEVESDPNIVYALIMMDDDGAHLKQKPQKRYEKGRCKECGIKTGQDKKNGKYYQYCMNHNKYMK